MSMFQLTRGASDTDLDSILSDFYRFRALRDKLPARFKFAKIGYARFASMPCYGVVRGTCFRQTNATDTACGSAACFMFPLESLTGHRYKRSRDSDVVAALSSLLSRSFKAIYDDTVSYRSSSRGLLTNHAHQKIDTSSLSLWNPCLYDLSKILS